ncbi:MAG: carboxypeptidase regulatory-like domain-containing protein [Acidobacteria bacterium]|nr:carboxypeptidase regulatory-like domain-containing protein [Acidobacteriota bacterium]
MRKAALIVAVFLLLPAFLALTCLAAEEEETTRLTVRVVSETNDKPVNDAHVVVHFVTARTLRRDKRTSWEAKTNQRGMLVLTQIPYGAVKVQVVARGYQTHGEQYELSKPEQELTIKLKLPAEQVSAY